MALLHGLHEHYTELRMGEKRITSRRQQIPLGINDVLPSDMAHQICDLKE